MRLTVSGDGVTTAQLRRVLAECSKASRHEDAPESELNRASRGMAFVGCDGPELFRFKTMPMRADGAAMVVLALTQTGDK